jgi:THO complex subunit 2
MLRRIAGDEGTSAPVLTAEDTIAATLTQHLVHPRLMMSPIDAVYCTQFCLLLHEMQAPRFSTLHCVDRVVRTITPLIFCTTEAEASFIGYALTDILSVVNHWHDCDEAVYNAEARDKLGFSYGFGRAVVAVAGSVEAANQTEPGQSGAVADSEAGASTSMVVDAGSKPEASTAVSQTQFKAFCKVSGNDSVSGKFSKVIAVCILAQNWHTRLYNIVRASLKVGDREYIYIRSGLILMARVSEQFPSRAKEGDQLIALVTQLIAAEKDRGDLQVMGKSLLTILKKRADLWLNDSPHRRLAALKAQAKAAALAKAKAEKEAAAVAAAAAAASTSSKAKDVPPPQSAVRGRGAENGSSGNLRSAAGGTSARDDATGVRRSDGPRDSGVGGSSSAPGIRGSDSKQDVSGRDRRDAPRDGRDGGRDGRDTSGKDLPPRDPNRDATGREPAGRDAGREAQKPKDIRDRDTNRDARDSKDSGRDAKDSRATAGRDSRERAPAPGPAAPGDRHRDNSRDRRGSFGNSGSTSASASNVLPQPSALAGSKRKSGDDDRSEPTKLVAGADNSASAAPNKAVRRAVSTHATSNAKVDDPTNRPAPPLAQPSSDRKDKDKAPEKLLTATSNAKVDDGARSTAPSKTRDAERSAESKQGQDHSGASRKAEPSKDSLRDTAGRDTARDSARDSARENNGKGREENRGRDSKAGGREEGPVAQQDVGGNNKRSRETAGLSNDAPPSTRRATSGGNSGNTRQLEDGSPIPANSPAPNSQAAQLLAMKGAAKQSGNGVGGTGGNNTAELLAMKDAVKAGRRGDNLTSLSSLKAPPPAGGELDALLIFLHSV